MKGTCFSGTDTREDGQWLIYEYHTVTLVGECTLAKGITSWALDMIGKA